MKTKLPKAGIKIGQYLMCWLILLIAGILPEFQDITSGLSIYLYAGSLSVLLIALFMRYGGKNAISLTLCLLELIAISWILLSLWANLERETNFFHTHFRASLEYLYLTEIAVLMMVGLYGLTKLVWMAGRRLFDNRSNHYRESLIYPFLHERRKRRR